MAIKIAKTDVAQKKIEEKTKATVRKQNDDAAAKARDQKFSDVANGTIKAMGRTINDSKACGSTNAVWNSSAKDRYEAALAVALKRMAEERAPKPQEPVIIDRVDFDGFIKSVIEKHKERLAYNAAYQRDLRTIKRLGLEMTVAEWRSGNKAYGDTK